MSSWTAIRSLSKPTRPEFDPAALFRGLPDDRCQCPHWGVVISGTIVYRYVDREETYVAATRTTARPDIFRCCPRAPS